MEIIRIDKTKTGRPAYWVGGGAFTNTFTGRFVLKKDWDWTLPRPLFVRERGDLACVHDQALVPLEVGDVIVSVGGTRGDWNCPTSKLVGKHILEIGREDADNLTAKVEDIEMRWDDVPQSIIRAFETYHNRDGRLFIADAVPAGTA